MSPCTERFASRGRVPRAIDHMVGVSRTAGNPVNHVCIAMSRDDVDHRDPLLPEYGNRAAL